jgi:hypothetical protein
MKKNFIVWLLISTMAGIIALPALSTVQAYQHCIDGEDLSYLEHLTTSPYVAWYCECHHMVWEGDPDDSMAGLSLQADYASAQDPRFTWAQWDLEKQWGDGDVTSISGLSVDCCVNGNDHHYYTCYDSPTWGYPPLSLDLPSPFECWYVYYPAGGSFDPVNSVEGSSTAAFYHPSDPPSYPYFGQIWWVDAYTQNPSYHPDGNGWSFLTAHYS